MKAPSTAKRLINIMWPFSTCLDSYAWGWRCCTGCSLTCKFILENMSSGHSGTQQSKYGEKWGVCFRRKSAYANRSRHFRTPTGITRSMQQGWWTQKSCQSGRPTEMCYFIFFCTLGVYAEHFNGVDYAFCMNSCWNLHFPAYRRVLMNDTWEGH